MPSNTCDVLVIGGGPAGSAVSTWLAEKGWRVALMEKEHHPRFHIGESLLPMSLAHLDRLGVRQDLERIGLRKYAAEFDSRYHGKSSHFYFAEALNNAFPYAYQVRRSEFDELLFRNATARGVQGYEGHRVTTIDFGNIDPIVTVIAEDGNEQHWQARFIIDASGRDTMLANHFGIKERNKHHCSAALYAHFHDAIRYTGEAEGNISIYWFDYGWFWMIPLKDGTMSVGAVCSPKYLKSRDKPVADFFYDTIALCPQVQKRLAAAKLVSEVTATGNYSYQAKQLYGKNYLLIGDAFAFVDPVFSGGVHLALSSASYAAQAVDTILRKPHTLAKELQRYEKTVVRAWKMFSWFTYRMTMPAMRDMIIEPKNVLRVKNGIISLLAGDIYQGAPIGLPILVFKTIFYMKTLFDPWRNYAAYQRRKSNLAL